jgi:predicted dehydrogenase
MRRDAAKAKDYANRHNVPRWYDDADKLINDPEVNAIYIATPPSSHEALSIAAMNAGKHVYVEKPMALNYAAAFNMAKTANEKNVKLVVAHYRRAQPFFNKIKQLITDKAIGEIRLARMEFYRPGYSKSDLEMPGKAWRVDPAISGGGIFHDLAPHQLDLMFHFFGPVKKVTGIAVSQSDLYTADDMVVGTILFEHNIAFNGTWCFNAASELSTDHCEIIGSEGKIHFSVFNNKAFTVTTKEGSSVYTYDALQHVQQPMIERTVQYFLGEGPNPCSGEDGAETMRLIDEIVKN